MVESKLEILDVILGMHESQSDLKTLCFHFATSSENIFGRFVLPVYMFLVKFEHKIWNQKLWF